MLWRAIRSAAVRADERQALLRWQLSVRGQVHDTSRRALGRTAPSEGSGSSPRSRRRGSPEGAPGPNVSCQGAAPGPDQVTSHSLRGPCRSRLESGLEGLRARERPGCSWGRTPPCRTRRTADSPHPTWAGRLRKDGSTAAPRPRAGHVRRGGRKTRTARDRSSSRSRPASVPPATGQGTQRDARRRAAGGPGRPLTRPRRRRGVRRQPSPRQDSRHLCRSEQSVSSHEDAELGGSVGTPVAVGALDVNKHREASFSGQLGPPYSLAVEATTGNCLRVRCWHAFTDRGPPSAWGHAWAGRPRPRRGRGNS